MPYKKKCGLCKIHKEESEFSKSSFTKDGLSSRCRECNKIADYKKNYEPCTLKTYAEIKEYRDKNPIDLSKYKRK